MHKVKCENCADTGWVCENHTDHPWGGLPNVEECCGGAGQPCVCNLDLSKDVMIAIHASVDSIPPGKRVH